MKRLITKTDLSKYVDVSQAAITKLCNAGGKLERACVQHNNKLVLDLDHLSVRSYIESKRLNPNSLQPRIIVNNNSIKQKINKKKTTNINSKNKKNEKLNTEEYQEIEELKYNNKDEKAQTYHSGDKKIPDDITDLANLTIREAVLLHGTSYRMLEYIKIIKEIEQIDARRVQTAKLRSELISRELVQKAFIDQVEICHKQLLSDGSKTISKILKSMVEAGNDNDSELEKFVSKTISSFIKPMKNKIKKSLEDLESNLY